MLHLLLLLLVGTVYAEGSGAQDDLVRHIVPDVEMDECKMPEVLENTPLSDCRMERCRNVSVDVNCGPKPGDMSPDQGTCHLRVITCPKTFPQAHEYCRCHRGSLCSIHSNCANNQVRFRAQTACGNQYRYVWIGVSKNSNSCQYVNADGTKLDYTNWACGNPQNCGSWCTALNVGNGQWFSLKCCTQLPFVCSI